MMIYVLQGAALALSATIMPGPFQAFLLSKALRNRWRRTLPAAFAPIATAGKINPKANTILRVIAAVALFGFGLYQIGIGIQAILAS